VKNSKLKTWAVRIGEMLLALSLVLVFFGVFMGILGLSFPEGTGLGDLLRDDSPFNLEREPLVLDPSADRGVDSFVALLTQVSHKVKDKRADAVSWNSSSVGTKLLNRHAVQTFDRSRATIVFTEDSRMELGPNSLVIVKRLDQTRGTRDKRASLLVMSGTLSGSLSSGAGESIQVEFATAAARSVVRSAAGERTEFRLKAGDDESTTLSILDGTAEVEFNGERIEVGPNEAVRVHPTAGRVGPMTLPDAPALELPEDRSDFAFRDLPPEVDFEWFARNDVDSFRLDLATDPEFTDVVHESVIASNAFEHANLPEGEYYWRVTPLRDGIEGHTSQAREFRVWHDLEPPNLEVVFPPERVDGASFLLRGTTEPGARVFVGTQDVAVSELGEFELELALEPGLNVVVVEAYDAAGNAAYQSRMVRAEY